MALATWKPLSDLDKNGFGGVCRRKPDWSGFKKGQKELDVVN